jgi:hypothetical protein
MPPSCFTLRSLMPALLPMTDEFRMNFEGLGVFFSTYQLFSAAFLELGANFAENVYTQSFESPIPRKKPCRIGPRLCRTSGNAHNGKFAELNFHELRRRRSELRTSRGRKRNLRIFEPSRGFDTPLSMPLKNCRFLCRSRPRYPQLLKAALNVFVAERQTLDDPRDLTEQTTAQSGFYTHRGQDSRTSSIRPGALTPDTPPPVASSRTWMDPRGRHRKMRKSLQSDLGRLTLGLAQDSTLIYASFVKRPHESGST